ncbi:hypothetical protein HHI36_007016 [Cryptolaemus montrouzieri]|uniref:Spermatogenesis-associated protein 6 N-terminal domain-containing protein n=1 Tax=Cryptolaemus montrouzieri TaxID=559131 RepID=A0ABD2MNQ2_9CUCU
MRNILNFWSYFYNKNELYFNIMAGRKAFIVKVDLDVQAVTCPGVWLCSNGQVSLQIYMLDSCVQTSSFRPSFPMLFHEQFIFTKTLPTKYHLEDLNKQLSREWLYVELIQWENCECGNVLAYFQIPLNELLYPNVSGGVPSGAEVDLLMEPTPAFPGALAPKLEVSTKTTIEETICSCVQQKPNISTVLNPKTIMSCTGRPRGHRAVCHSSPNKLHRNRKCRQTCLMRCKVYERPPWRYRRVEDGFLQRQRVLDLPLQPTPQLELDGGPDGGPYGGPRRTHPERGMEIRKILKESLRKALGQPAPSGPCQPGDRVCTCGQGHAENACTVCQKYSGVFSNKIAQQDQQKQVFFSTTKPDKSLYNQILRQSRRNYGAYGEVCPEVQKPKKNLITCKAHADHPGVCAVAYEVPQKKGSIAQKLHDRISRTLHSIPQYLDEVTDMCRGVGDCEVSSGQCTCDQFPDMRKFYRELYQEEYN